MTSRRLTNRVDVSSTTMDRVQQFYSTAAARLNLATKGRSVGEVVELHDQTTGRSPSQA